MASGGADLGPAQHLEVDEVSEDSSSPALSSPPRSPDYNHPLGASSNAPSNSAIGNNLGVVLSTSSTPAPATASSNKNGSATTPSATTTAPAKKPRKKREPKPADGDDKPKEKKARKPRQPKDPNAPAQPRKRQKITDPTHDAKAGTTSQPTFLQSKITDSMIGSTSTVQAPLPQRSLQCSAARANSNTPAEHIHPHPAVSHLAATSNPSTPRPASSGQLFDPIRSATIDAPSAHNANTALPVSSSKVVNRASASPSITSLIDPMPPVTSAGVKTLAPQSSRVPPPGPSTAAAPATPAPTSTKQIPSTAPSNPAPPPKINMASNPDVIEIDLDKDSAKGLLSTAKNSDSATPSSAAPTPPAKPARQKEAPPPLPTGSGLLSGSPFGGLTSAPNGTSSNPVGTNIWLTFPLKGQNNVTINFAQEVQKKYGFAALYPRIAARNERRRQMAAAGAALESALAGGGGGSADDMSLDLSEPEDSNAEMGGVDDDGAGSTGTGEKKPQRRRKKVEDYDRTDDFIDDTEMVWEEQRLMAKDGFFVYSGPLVTEGEKPAVERADGTVKRGRGRGRGGTTRGDATGRGRGGGGRGSRGGMTVRKPRVTKAERAQREQEKFERERMASTLAAKPAQYPGTVP